MLARDWTRTLSSPWLVAALIAAGIAVRVAWLLLQRDDLWAPALGEAFNVARAFAATGRIDDAYFAGQGPTAHLMPINPVIAGVVYRAFGVATPLSEGLLTGWSIGVVMLSFWLLWRCFGELGSPPLARLGALAVLCLAPLNFSTEVTVFKIWEGGLAVATMAGFLLVVLRLDKQPGPISTLQVAGTGLLAAVLLFISPPFGITAYLCGLILLYRRVPPRRWGVSALLVLAATIAVLGPWTVRNAEVMGRAIVLRSNMPLEMALAYHPEAVDPPSEQKAFAAHYEQTHPTRAPGARALVAAGGELAYMDQLKARTDAWIAANPGDFARLTLRHVRDFLFPPAWYWSQFGGPSVATGPKVWLNWAITALALGGIALALVRGGSRYVYPALMTLLPVIPYALVQPNLRYRYIVVALMIFFAADFVMRLVRGAAGRSGASPRAARA